MLLKYLQTSYGVQSILHTDTDYVCHKKNVQGSLTLKNKKILKFNLRQMTNTVQKCKYFLEND